MRATTTGLRAFGALCALLLATAACTSHDGSASAPGSGARTGTGPAPGTDAAKGGDGTGGDASVPLTAPQLERAALATGDLPGYQVLAGKSALAPTGQPVADKAACRPLADAMGAEPDARATHTVSRGLGSLDDLGLAVSVSLSSYSVDDAEELIGGLEAAVAACGAGFRATLDGRSTTYRDVKAVPFAARGGDRTVSWTAVAADEGAVSPVHLVVVGRGATVARFTAFDLAGGKPPRVPGAVVVRQLAKIARQVAG
ncbi:hypothetical protein [Streptomyces peucetius]|uniref:PknH-like extracellular domain-containing protein n=1 Tax=Streptomyces peucetius TaxID=1950 RepID=A0ABY6IAM3_STRPE|nr:hypothetical protein [Streptomyces peucetius]UYQ64040.1 hypothetical protein OGH68_22940 [Streptomyces peucetius]